MIDIILGVLTAAVSTFGFAVLFRVDTKYIPWGVLGGGLCWAVYLSVELFVPSVFITSVVAAVVATFYSEVLAYICRTPATVFLLPSLVPMVPGSSLYYTMSNLIMKNYAAATEKGIATLEVMLGVSGGVVAASLIVYTIRHLKKRAITKRG